MHLLFVLVAMAGACYNDLSSISSHESTDVMQFAANTRALRHASLAGAAAGLVAAAAAAPA